MTELAPPPLRWLFREGLALTFVILAPFLPAVRSKQDGKGVPVLIIPGLLANDSSTARLRKSLNANGFRAFGWGLGTNFGLRPALLNRLESRVEEIAAQCEEKPVLLGWSLGGLYARELAHRRPDLIKLVMTLCSPFSGSRRANNAWRVYEWLNDHTVENPPIKRDPWAKPPIPTAAVWSDRDGIVSAGSAKGLQGETDWADRIPSTHMGLATRSKWIRQIIALLSEKLQSSPG